MQNIVWLSENLENTDQLGGKASSLRTLFRRGLPVPDAFVVNAGIKMMTPGLEEELLAAFDKLASKKVAVRSSALGEDGSEASWAGQFETYLNIERGELIDAVKKCWQSVDNERSLAYASAKGQDTETDIAVVVQAMIPSDLSGVMFSRDPRGDDKDSIIIEAAKGVGEKLVQGEINPDEYTVSRSNLKITKRKLQKETALLTDDQIAEVADYGMRIEALYGKPQDVEWAIADDKVYILQARPITTLQHITTDSLIPTWKDQLLFRWGPVPGELFYMNDYVDACAAVIRSEGIDYFPEMLAVFQHGEVLWVCEQEKMTAMGKRCFSSLLATPGQFEAQQQAYHQAVKRKHEFEQQLGKTNIEELSKEGVADLLENYYDILLNFWKPTIPTELGNYGSTEVLNDALSNDMPDPKERARLANALVLSTKLTYSQQEEVELAATNDIKAHAQKWYWLLNSYAGPQELDEKFFVDRKAELSSNDEADLAEPDHIDKVSDQAAAIAKTITEGMLWQDNRKAELLKSVTWKGKLLAQAGKLLKMPIGQLKSSPIKGVIELLRGGKSVSYAGYHFKGIELDYLNQSQNNLAWELYAYHSLRQKMDGVQGVVASRGAQLITHGHAIIVHDPKEKVDFPEGSILVAQMTTPDYIFYMRKASAVVTDTGGITSHAAIVSRELNVPCIVGSKNATKLFKNGDLLQVNTLHGTVLRMKKA